MTTLTTLVTHYQEHQRRYRAEMDRQKRQLLSSLYEPEHRKHQRAVAKRFGELNGWQLSKAPFEPKDLGTTRTDPFSRYGWEDHRILYRKLGCNIAIVGQPYGTLGGDRRDRRDRRPELDETAQQYGLCWHVPPHQYASFWLPGSTLFIVMTLPGIQVQWLPEQLNGIPAITFSENEAMVE